MTVLGCDGSGGGYSCVQKDQETLTFFTVKILESSDDFMKISQIKNLFLE